MYYIQIPVVAVKQPFNSKLLNVDVSVIIILYKESMYALRNFIIIFLHTHLTFF